MLRFVSTHLLHNRGTAFALVEKAWDSGFTGREMHGSLFFALFDGLTIWSVTILSGNGFRNGFGIVHDSLSFASGKGDVLGSGRVYNFGFTSCLKLNKRL